jgi:hypothetical protein
MTLVRPQITAHDPGGKVKLPLPAGVTGEAFFSDCGRYRWLLWRRWPHTGKDGFALWIGMNPSTAAEDVDDPTVKREWTYTRDRLDLGSYAKANVMDYRATHPEDLRAPGIVPQSADNGREIIGNARHAAIVVLAFGALPKPFRRYAAEIVGRLEAEGIALWCMGFTKDGSPRHPLYVAGETQLVPFPRGSYRAAP